MRWEAAHLEEISCDGCGGTSTAPIHVRPDAMTVAECATCHLAYLNPRPKADRIKRLYDHDYFVGDGDESALGYAKDYTDAESRYHLEKASQQRIEMIERHIDLSGKSLLEVGSAAGDFVRAAAYRCREVFGIDISYEIVETARTRYSGIRLRSGEIFDLDPARETFDVICAFEVIEHLLSPRRFLDHARTLITEEGMLFLSTPNYGCVGEVPPEKWLGFRMSWEHLYFFSDRSLARLASECGFRKVAAYTAGSGATEGPGPMRRLAVSILRRARLLPSARRMRDRIADIGRFRHTTDLSGHNLVMVLAPRRP